MKGILEELRTFSSRLDELIGAFALFNVGSEELPPGTAEIGLLIPRAAVHDKLGDFADELDEMEFILNTFSEVATGRKDDLIIKTVSSSEFMVFLVAAAPLAVVMARAIDFVVGQHKKILDIRKVQLEIDRLEFPTAISNQTREHANKIMEQGIDKFSITVINEFRGDKGRKNEQTTAVKLNLNAMANRIDRGFNFEVRIQPPDVESIVEDNGVNEAVAAVQVASANMQYKKLEGPPILQLPETVDGGRISDRKPKNQRKAEADETAPSVLRAGGKRRVRLQDEEGTSSNRTSKQDKPPES